MKLRRVVVTGLGAVTPIGNTVEEYWDSLEKGVSGAQPITKFDASKFKTQFACEVKGFNVNEYLDRKEARKMDLFCQYAMAVGDQAIKDSKLDLDAIDKSRVGVIWGAGIGGLTSLQKEVIDFANGDGTPRFNPFFIPKMLVDLAPGHLAIKYGFSGPNFSTVSACASATNAFVDAFNYIRLGKADMFLAGGTEACVNESGIGGFNALKALSTRNDSPESASRPFDQNRDGFVLGEGGGALILEELDHALARGAKIYAEVMGGGMSCDAHHMTAPHPEGEGVVKVMQEALKDANMSPDEIDYINVHGTSTPLGDVAELKGIQKVFGDHAYEMNISSTKSMTGHLLGAAGAIEALASIFALERQTVPPTINNETRDENIDPRFKLTLNKAEKREVNAVLSNTFGFGGHNFSIILKKFAE
ncbi:beta-ketoacyl-ACP synthase II [Sediminitomix flava]|uniref:3-oxoacyl-[acyl-carrier-protein] synthase 2 n=1 Tax=Sediminitomix flava TaxID=379075 RepID=A0A315ZH62_SEDFL|nr:beta-ketoacyl-ACP synthase II [Sediminitomix flava]PWJ44945.1 3-oxoacyl-[acyl-carrier-protein] synthase II [Sediminitomix flava]